MGLALVAALWFGARHQAEPMVPFDRVNAGSPVARGAVAFVSEDFGGLSMDALETHALPWKLVAAALVLQADDTDISQDALARRLQAFGILTDVQIANLPEGIVQTTSDVPFGMTTGMVAPIGGASVQVANLGCAACHAGVTYDSQGAPRPDRVWLGMPNTSLDLEAYTQAIFDSLSEALETPDRVLATVTRLFPETSWGERQTLRWMVLPLVRSRLADITTGRPLPFPNGVPGSTNGVAALKFGFGLPLLGGGPEDAGIVSIPDLGHRYWKTSLLSDGAYAMPDLARSREITAVDLTNDHFEAVAEITTFFTVPSMGVDPEHAVASLPEANDIFAFLADSYRPQPFPGGIDPALARSGADVYGATCAACHGEYDITAGQPTLTRFPNWIGDVGTDGLRAKAFDTDLAVRVSSTAYSDRIDAQSTGAYAAPPLTGLWASAPYLHNGSVPTIGELLSPSDRTPTFQLGGHALDFSRMGLLHEAGAYPPDYAPFSNPVVFDTTEPGKGNQGHEYGAGLSADDKRALIEFLKQL